MELKPRKINGKMSDTHFLYTDKIGREWSVVDFEKFMSSPFLKEFFGTRTHADMFGYNWEGMNFGGNENNLQVRGMSAEEVVKQIEEL